MGKDRFCHKKIPTSPWMIDYSPKICEYHNWRGIGSLCRQVIDSVNMDYGRVYINLFPICVASM